MIFYAAKQALKRWFVVQGLKQVSKLQCCTAITIGNAGRFVESEAAVSENVEIKMASFVFFWGNRRLSLRAEDLSTEKVSMIFQNVLIAEVVEGKPETRKSITVWFSELECSVGSITAKVAEALGPEERIVLIDSRGNEIMDCEGTRELTTQRGCRQRAPQRKTPHPQWQTMDLMSRHLVAAGLMMRAQAQREQREEREQRQKESREKKAAAQKQTIEVIFGLGVLPQVQILISRAMRTAMGQFIMLIQQQKKLPKKGELWKLDKPWIRSYAPKRLNNDLYETMTDNTDAKNNRESEGDEGHERAQEQEEIEPEEEREEEVGEVESEASERQSESEEEDIRAQIEGQNEGQPDSPCMSSTAPSDISKCRDDSPVQPHLKTFPTTLMGDRRRSFRAHWYRIQPWTEYSVVKDSVFCYACRHFSPAKASASVFVSPLGFRNWKKATEREGGFSVHTKSDRHKQAMIAWRDYQRAVKTNATLANVLNKQHTKQVKENREYIKTIDEVLLLTARQNITQRGHDESEESINKGNFREILDTIAHHDALVKHRLTTIHNSKYTRKTIQNEVLDCLAEMVRSEIIEESLYVFTSGSYVHCKWLTVQREMYGSTRELQQLSDTRWACRFLALTNIMDRLPALKRVLQEVAQERRGEKSSESRGLLAQIDFEFVVHLVTLRKLFGETKLLSDMLQSPTDDLSRAVDLVEALAQTLNDFRQESFFDSLWGEVLNIWSCVANASVFLPPQLRLLCLLGDLVCASSLPACGPSCRRLLSCVSPRSEYAREDGTYCSVSQHRRHYHVADTTPRTLSLTGAFMEQRRDPGTTLHPSPLHLFAHLNIKDLLFTVYLLPELSFWVQALTKP
ncbi:hypothetical protein ABVT39_004753 [Epinephelus coioides]